jgi:hypothetical protein
MFEMPSAENVSSPLSSSSSVGKTVKRIVLLVVVCVAAEYVGHWVGTQVARNEIANAAVVNGVFGTSWLMSPEQVRKAIPNAVPAGDKLFESRKVYGRRADLEYMFKGNQLLAVIVTFSGEKSQATYDETQRQLAADYGTMPEPEIIDDELRSQKLFDYFGVTHQKYTKFWMPVEQILYYRTTSNPSN